MGGKSCPPQGTVRLASAERRYVVTIRHIPYRTDKLTEHTAGTPGKHQAGPTGRLRLGNGGRNAQFGVGHAPYRADTLAGCENDRRGRNRDEGQDNDILDHILTVLLFPEVFEDR